MVQVLSYKSLGFVNERSCRVDIDWRQKKDLADETKHYEFETHIFFDDAIEITESGSKPNRFVRCFIELVDTAAT